MNVTFIKLENPNHTFTDYAVISWGNDEFTTMTKAEYDKEYPDAPKS